MSKSIFSFFKVVSEDERKRLEAETDKSVALRAEIKAEVKEVSKRLGLETVGVHHNVHQLPFGAAALCGSDDVLDRVESTPKRSADSDEKEEYASVEAEALFRAADEKAPEETLLAMEAHERVPEPVVSPPSPSVSVTAVSACDDFLGVHPPTPSANYSGLTSVVERPCGTASAASASSADRVQDPRVPSLESPSSSSSVVVREGAREPMVGEKRPAEGEASAEGAAPKYTEEDLKKLRVAELKVRRVARHCATEVALRY
jgi:hypothetical protein